jgi:hypothetical protein
MTSYMVQQLVHVTLNFRCFHRIVYIVVYGMFVRQHTFFICVDCEWKSFELRWASLTGWVLVFLFTNAVILILQSVQLAGCDCFFPLPDTVQNLCHTVSTDLWNCSMHITFPAWDAIFTTLCVVERFGNSVGMNYKFDHITYSDAFSFHYCALQFMSKTIYFMCTPYLQLFYCNDQVSSMYLFIGQFTIRICHTWGVCVIC